MKLMQVVCCLVQNTACTGLRVQVLYISGVSAFCCPCSWLCSPTSNLRYVSLHLLAAPS